MNADDFAKVSIEVIGSTEVVKCCFICESIENACLYLVQIALSGRFPCGIRIKKTVPPSFGQLTLTVPP